MNVLQFLNTQQLHSLLPLSKKYVFLFGITFLAPLQLFTQQTDFIPKSKHEIERLKDNEEKERRRIITSGIYSLVQTKYLYKFGVVDRDGKLELTSRYNKAGRKIEEIRYNEYDKSELSRTTYKYDNKGNLIEEVVKKDGKNYKVTHRYNTNGKIIESVHYKFDGTVEKKITYVYDDNGLLIETFGYLSDGRIFFRDSYLYDTRGWCLELKNNLNKFTYQYDAHGNVTLILKFARYYISADSSVYTLTDKYIFTYDSNNYLVELLHFRADSLLQKKLVYTVDSRGYLREEKEYAGDGRLVFQRSLYYDKKNNLVEEKGNDRGRVFRHTYKYDAAGNRTEWTAYDQINEPLSVTKYFYSKSSVNRATPSLPKIESDDKADEGDAISLDEYNELIGCRIVAPDGSFLGTIIADTVHPHSIINSWGQYGFEESPSSIFNTTIPYGGAEGMFSPFNPKSPSPPSLYKEGKFYAYFTENPNFRPRISPRKLISLLRSTVQVQQ